MPNIIFEKIITETVFAAKLGGVEAAEFKKELETHFASASQDLLIRGKSETEVMENFGDPEIIGAAVHHSHEPYAQIPLIGDLIYYPPLRYGITLFIYSIIGIGLLAFIFLFLVYITCNFSMHFWEKIGWLILPTPLVIMGLFSGWRLNKKINNFPILVLTLTISLIPIFCAMTLGFIQYNLPQMFTNYLTPDANELLINTCVPLVGYLAAFFYSTFILVTGGKLLYYKIRHQKSEKNILPAKPLIKIAIILSCILNLILLGIFCLNYAFTKDLQPNSIINELTFPDGPVLIGLYDTYNPRLKILSSAGNFYAEFGMQSSYDKYINTQEILVSGKLSKSSTLQPTAGNLFWVTPDQVTQLSNPFPDLQLYNLTLSQDKNFLKYEPANPDKNNYRTENICVSSFSLTGLGPCDELMRFFPEEFRDNRKYAVRVDWLQDQNILGIKINNMENLGDNAIARYTYDPQTKTLLTVSNLNFRFKNYPKIEAENNRANYFTDQGNYETIYNWREGEILIKDKSRGQRAVLTLAPFMGDMPEFDLIFFGRN